MCVRNTLGNWVILIFSGQKACTRIFKPHRFVFLHFSRPKDVISYLWCYYHQRQFLMGAPEKIHFKFHQNWENTQVKLPCIRFHFVKFVFSGSKKNLFLRSYSIQLIALFYSPWKLWKRMQYAWNYSGTRFLSSFPNGFHVNYLFFCCLVMIPFLVKTCGMFPIQDNTPVTFTSSCKCLGRKIKIQIPSSVVK